MCGVVVLWMVAQQPRIYKIFNRMHYPRRSVAKQSQLHPVNIYPCVHSNMHCVLHNLKQSGRNYYNQ